MSIGDEEPSSDDTLELTEQVTGEDPGEEQPSEKQEGDEQPGETVATFDDEADKPDDSSTIREMRRQLREARREAAELRQRSAPPPVEVGDKPTLAGCEYDEEAFETALDEWKERKRQADDQQQSQVQQREAIQKEWEEDLASTREKAQRHGFAEFETAAAIVMDGLSIAQQSALIQGAADPAAVTMALSASPARLAELAKITNPIKFAAAVVRMEGAIKVQKRGGPKVDTPVRGSGAMPGGADKELARLEAEAEKSGDRSKLIRYKADQRKAGK